MCEGQKRVGDINSFYMSEIDRFHRGLVDDVNRYNPYMINNVNNYESLMIKVSNKILDPFNTSDKSDDHSNNQEIKQPPSKIIQNKQNERFLGIKRHQEEKNKENIDEDFTFGSNSNTTGNVKQLSLIDNLCKQKINDQKTVETTSIYDHEYEPEEAGVNDDDNDIPKANIPKQKNKRKRVSSKRKNTFITTANRKSIYRGVSKNGNQWQALITVRKKKIYIGTFPTEEEAARQYDLVALKNLGSEAKTNFSYNDTYN